MVSNFLAASLPEMSRPCPVRRSRGRRRLPHVLFKRPNCLSGSACRLLSQRPASLTGGKCATGHPIVGFCALTNALAPHPPVIVKPVGTSLPLKRPHAECAQSDEAPQHPEVGTVGSSLLADPVEPPCKRLKPSPGARPEEHRQNSPMRISVLPCSPVPGDPVLSNADGTPVAPQVQPITTAQVAPAHVSAVCSVPVEIAAPGHVSSVNVGASVVPRLPQSMASFQLQSGLQSLSQTPSPSQPLSLDEAKAMAGAQAAANAKAQLAQVQAASSQAFSAASQASHPGQPEGHPLDASKALTSSEHGAPKNAAVEAEAEAGKLKANAEAQAAKLPLLLAKAEAAAAKALVRAEKEKKKAEVAEASKLAKLAAKAKKKADALSLAVIQARHLLESKARSKSQAEARAKSMYDAKALAQKAALDQAPALALALERGDAEAIVSARSQGQVLPVSPLAVLSTPALPIPPLSPLPLIADFASSTGGAPLHPLGVGNAGLVSSPQTVYRSPLILTSKPVQEAALPPTTAIPIAKSPVVLKSEQAEVVRHGLVDAVVSVVVEEMWPGIDGLTQLLDNAKRADLVATMTEADQWSAVLVYETCESFIEKVSKLVLEPCAKKGELSSTDSANYILAVGAFSIEVGAALKNCLHGFQAGKLKPEAFKPAFQFFVSGMGLGCFVLFVGQCASYLQKLKLPIDDVQSLGERRPASEIEGCLDSFCAMWINVDKLYLRCCRGASPVVSIVQAHSDLKWGPTARKMLRRSLKKMQNESLADLKPVKKVVSRIWVETLRELDLAKASKVSKDYAVGGSKTSSPAESCDGGVEIAQPKGVKLASGGAVAKASYVAPRSPKVAPNANQARADDLGALARVRPPISASQPTKRVASPADSGEIEIVAVSGSFKLKPTKGIEKQRSQSTPSKAQAGSGVGDFLARKRKEQAAAQDSKFSENLVTSDVTLSSPPFPYRPNPEVVADSDPVGFLKHSYEAKNPSKSAVRVREDAMLWPYAGESYDAASGRFMRAGAVCQAVTPTLTVRRVAFSTFNQETVITVEHKDDVLQWDVSDPLDTVNTTEPFQEAVRGRIQNSNPAGFLLYFRTAMGVIQEGFQKANMEFPERKLSDTEIQKNLTR